MSGPWLVVIAAEVSCWFALSSVVGSKENAVPFLLPLALGFCVVSVDVNCSDTHLQFPPIEAT